MTNYRDFFQLSRLDRQGIFGESAEKQRTSPRNIEKDFWICLLLDAIFMEGSRRWPRLAFRGGTSLSKAFGLIERFSEDIDLGIERRDIGIEETLASLEKLDASRRQKRLEALNKAGGSFVAETLVPHLQKTLDALFVDHKDPPERPKLRLSRHDPLTVEIPFQPITAETSGYVPTTVRLEFSIRSALSPTETRSISPYISQVSDELNLDLRNVPTIKARRTFWDKVLIAHEIKQRHRKGFPLAVGNERVSRHYYDLWMLLKARVGKPCKTQLRLLEDCRRHSELFYPNPQVDLSAAAPGTLDFAPDKSLMNHLEVDYDKMAVMIFGEPPTLAAIVERLAAFEEEVNTSDVLAP